MQSTRSGDLLTVAGDYVLDATDLGELLELGAVEHVIGAELLLPRWWHIGRPRLEAGYRVVDPRIRYR